MATGLIALANVYNSAVGTGADILASDIAPTMGRSAFRVTVALGGAAKLEVEIDDGTTQKSLVLNDDTDLAASNLYTFVFGVDKTYTYNFQHDDAGSITVDYMLVEEILGGEI